MFTNLEEIFKNGRFSDLKLIFDDGNHQESVKVHKIIMWITSPTNFFHDLLSKNEGKNEIIVPVSNAYTAYDCIAYYFYEVTINKGNLKPAEHITKFIQCCDMFNIPFDFSLDKNIQFTATEFDALLNVICKMKYDKKYFRMIKIYFPNDYHFAIPRPNLYYDAIVYMLKECLAIVIDRGYDLNVVDIEGRVICTTYKSCSVGTTSIGGASIGGASIGGASIGGALQICNKTKSIMRIDHEKKIIRLHYFDINKKYSHKKHYEFVYENKCTQFLDSLENFFKLNHSNGTYYVINGELYVFNKFTSNKYTFTKLGITQLNIKDFYKNENILVCTTKNNDCMIIIDHKRVLSTKIDSNILDCVFVSNKVVVYTTKTSITVWNFEKNEHKILGYHDNKILCANLIANNILATCDNKLVVKFWDVEKIRMLHCLQSIPKSFMGKINPNIMGFLTKKILDRISE